MNTVKIQAGNCRLIAHRGVSGLEKENTNLAFVAAGNRSYYGIETDIHRTADGKFIVIHDRTTDRVAGMHCDVEQTDRSVLRRITLLDVNGEPGRPDLHLPTFEEYVDTCAKYEKVSVLELKGEISGEDADAIIATLRVRGHLEQTIFISFSLNDLILVRERLPEQPIQFLFKDTTPEIMEALRRYRFDVDVDYHALTEESIAAFHAEGIKVNCWTVNDPEKAARLISWGVDYMTTNILENG